MKNVPDQDYELLKFLHCQMANGKVIFMNPNVNTDGTELSPEEQQKNQAMHAAALKEYYGFSDNEVIEFAGFFVG